MPRRTLKLLEDVLDAATFIVEITSNETVDSYSRNRMLRQAIERNFEIIGEAIGRLRDHDPDVLQSLSDSSRIVGFRNVLIHGYDIVEHIVVWETARDQLPILIAEVVALMSRLEGGVHSP